MGNRENFDDGFDNDQQQDWIMCPDGRMRRQLQPLDSSTTILEEEEFGGEL